MNCPKCNAPVAQGARFCGNCGYNPQQAQVPPAPPPPQNYQTQPQQPQQAGGSFQVDSDGRGQGRGYSWEVQHAGAFALAVVNLQPEQSLAAEAGAMVSMSSNVELISQMKGGVF